MEQFSVSIDIPRPIEEMFSYFTKTANLTNLAPPDFHLELLEGPQVLQLGSQLVWKGRRWGISQQITYLVTTFENNNLIVEEQKKGPFRKWVQSHAFTQSTTGTLLREDIHFEPPGGMLGLMVTAAFIRKDLDKMFAYRGSKLKELFG